MGDNLQNSREERLDELLLKTSRTFALSIPVLPEPARREVTVAYLLFRVADTLEDATLWTGSRQEEELGRLAGLLARPSEAAASRLARRWNEDPPLENAAYLELLDELPELIESWRELAPQARDAVRVQTTRTIERMAAFVRRSGEGKTLELRSLPELQEYCYAVAGIVGEMLTELFLLGCPALEPIAESLRSRASTFGEALQLVNILKDSADDAGEGRRFLPDDVDRVRVFELARADLETAGSYSRDLQQAGAPRGYVAFTALPVLLARATLDRVERDGPGAKVTRPEVAAIAGALERALDQGGPAVPPHGLGA